MSDEMRAFKFDPRQLSVDHSGLRTTIWALDLREGETFGDCLNPDAFSKILAKHTPRVRDELRVYSHDGFNRTDYLVLAVDKAWMKLRPLQASIGEEAQPPVGSALNVRWNVGKRAYEVIRKADKSLLRSDFKLREDAVAWIEDHIKQMAA